MIGDQGVETIDNSIFKKLSQFYKNETKEEVERIPELLYNLQIKSRQARIQLNTKEEIDISVEIKNETKLVKMFIQYKLIKDSIKTKIANILINLIGIQKDFKTQSINVTDVILLSGAELFHSFFSKLLPNATIQTAAKEFASIGAAFIAANISHSFHTKNVISSLDPNPYSHSQYYLSRHCLLYTSPSPRDS